MKNPLNTAVKIHFGLQAAKKYAVRIIAFAALTALILCTY